MMGELRLVRIVSDWDSSRLLSETPGSSAIWGGFRFTVDGIRG